MESQRSCVDEQEAKRGKTMKFQPFNKYDLLAGYHFHAQGEWRQEIPANECIQTDRVGKA